MLSESDYIEYESPEEYFPYITHNLDMGKDKYKLKEQIINRLFEVHRQDGEYHHFTGESSLFRDLIVKYKKEHTEITNDPKAVQVIVSRHKSLFDYIIHQPVHHDLINKDIIIVAGHNLFVHQFNDTLRFFGGFMFLRDDTLLKHKGLPDVFLSKNNYLKHVFPEYLNDQVFCPAGRRHDMLVYLEYEKNRETGKSNSGRTKTGRLRELNWSFLKLLYELAHQNKINLYLTPVNVSFSKIPDAPYVVHPTKLEGSLKAIRYLTEQSFVFQRYAKFSDRHKKSKLDIVVNYGKPVCFSDVKLESFRDFRHFTEGFRKDIGKLEAIFPLVMIFKALDNDDAISEKKLKEKMDYLFEEFQEKGAEMFPVSDGRGNLRNKDEMIETALTLLNTNPSMYIMNYDQWHIITYKKGVLHCNDPLLKNWYQNMLNHFYEE